MIAQEAVIFPLSVLDNIRIGNPDAGREEIMEAAKKAGCHEFIMELPEGYDTLMEERGNNLSGGQRQRIAIARAVLKEAPILLLDEPTSALDRETEEYVNETLLAVAQDKTMITVAHRLGTIVNYDEILVLVNGVASVVAMLLYSPILMAVSLSFCFITVSISICINKQIKETEKKLQNKVSRLTTRLSDILSGFTELKMYRGSSIVSDHFHAENEKVLKDEKQRYGKEAKLEMESFLLGILASFGTIGVGAYMVACGQLDYGTVMAIVSLQMGVSALVQSFGSALATFSASLVKAGQIFNFLELNCEEMQDEKTVELQKDAFPVEVENITFSYDGHKDILTDFSIRLMEGEKVMLMGESGCGKSTLLKLIMGFYKKDTGSIKLYGREIDTCPLGQLRQLITYVPQSSYLFAGTVRENIGIGKQQVTDEEIMHATKMACADEFIRALPEGYDTRLDAGGTNLSVGQKQRIALARAFLKDSPILLMDEPSSALDVHSEQMILHAMGELMKNKTVIMVTHRSTLPDTFDHVVSM